MRKGQRVAALDPTALELAVRSQRAALSNAQARLVNASATETRQQTLRDRDVSAPATFEAAEQTRIAAEAEVVRAQSGLTKVQEQLGYAQLVSDFDGVVTAITAGGGPGRIRGRDRGDRAQPDVREAVIDIPESVNGDVQPGRCSTWRFSSMSVSAPPEPCVRSRRKQTALPGPGVSASLLIRHRRRSGWAPR